jgi:hypothetical protein
MLLNLIWINYCILQAALPRGVTEPPGRAPFCMYISGFFEEMIRAQGKYENVPF